MTNHLLRRFSGKSFLVSSAFILLHTLGTCSMAWQGKAIAVIEGDSIMVSHDTKRERVSLYGIDCPEKRQDFADVAKSYTKDRVHGQVVEVQPVGKDRYGHTNAVVSFEGGSLNLELVKSGLAWVHGQSCTRSECKEWREAQKQAKRRRLGLWSMSNPIPPWEYRKKREVQQFVFSGDIVTHVFHSTNCEEFDCWNCIASFRGREAAIKAGYKPCPICNP